MSFDQTRRFLLISGSALTLTACAPRGRLTVLPNAQGGTIVPIFVGTTRAVDPETDQFGANASEQVLFGRYDISVPPDRETGDVPVPRKNGTPDPLRHFVAKAATRMPEDLFDANLSAALRGADNPGREAVIFVHGFNTNFAEGLYRLAQLSYDLKFSGTIIHYSWPSNANPLGYVHDRDAATFARDGLETLIEQVGRAGASKIYLVAHSMGGAVTMEALRNMALRGNQRLIDRLGAVVLISPDLDVDVFRGQALALGELPQPFIIFGSQRDFALNIASRLTGEPERLGNLSDLGRVSDLEVTFFDTSNFNTDGGHFNVGNSPTLIALLSGIGSVDEALSNDQRMRVGLLPGAIITVRKATGVILAPVAVIGAEVAQQ
jgi:esterase/lipase superfamily enzyme